MSEAFSTAISYLRLKKFAFRKEWDLFRPELQTFVASIETEENRQDMMIINLLDEAISRHKDPQDRKVIWEAFFNACIKEKKNPFLLQNHSDLTFKLAKTIDADTLYSLNEQVSNAFPDEKPLVGWGSLFGALLLCKTQLARRIFNDMKNNGEDLATLMDLFKSVRDQIIVDKTLPEARIIKTLSFMNETANEEGFNTKHFYDNALNHAVNCNNAALLLSLVEAGADVATCLPAPINVAANQGKEDFVNLLYPLSDPNIRDIYPVLLAWNEHPELAEILYQRADIDGIKKILAGGDMTDVAASVISRWESDALRTKHTGGERKSAAGL